MREHPPVEQAISRFMSASIALQHATRVEVEGERRKPVMRRNALLRLVGSLNPLTEKPHSASSAEPLVNDDAEFSAFLRGCTDAVIDRMAAETAVEVTRWHVELAIAESKRMAEHVATVGA